MPESSNTRTTKKPARRADPRAVGRFIEELSWLLDSYSDLDFKTLGKFGADLPYMNRTTRNLMSHRNIASESVLLVGVLPGLFNDENLFATNEDIVEFSEHMLDVSIPRWQKKSKNEIIGHIVCHADQSGMQKLQFLSDALSNLVDKRSSARAAVAKQRKTGASWNEVIQSLSRYK